MRQPVGHNKLNTVVADVMQEARFEGYYPNHYLRATTATRVLGQMCLTDNQGANWPPQQCCFANKRTSSDQKSAVSDILQMKPKIRKLNQKTEARHVSDENVETSLLPTESCLTEEYADWQLSSKCRPKQNTEYSSSVWDPWQKKS